MTHLMLAFAWVWFTLGIASGAMLGLVFHKDDGWGGYDSWPRRLARLGHIAFFGTGVLVLAMALTCRAIASSPLVPHLDWLGPLVMLGAVSMPAVCFLSAWRKPFRHLFFIPVLALGVGVVAFTGLLIVQAL